MVRRVPWPICLALEGSGERDGWNVSFKPANSNWAHCVYGLTPGFGVQESQSGGWWLGPPLE